MSSTPLQNYTHQLTPPVNPQNVKSCTNRETPDLLKINCKNFQENQIVDTSITDADIGVYTFNANGLNFTNISYTSPIITPFLAENILNFTLQQPSMHHTLQHTNCRR